MAFSRHAHEAHPTPREIYNLRIYVLTFISCLGSWMFGYNNGVISGVLVLPAFHRDFDLQTVGSAAYNNTTANIVSFFQIGGLVGSMATFQAMKYWGRRISLGIAGCVYMLGAVLQVCLLSTK